MKRMKDDKKTQKMVPLYYKQICWKLFINASASEKKIKEGEALLLG